MESSKTVTSMFIFGGAVVGMYILWRRCTSSKEMPQNQEDKELKWESVGKVVKVFVYPVKSCKAISVQTAEADRLGLLYKGIRDRSFILVSDKGEVITGRATSTTVLIQATFENNILTLNFPGSEETKVDISQVLKNGKPVKANFWGKEVVGMDCGTDVSLWLHKNLKRKCQLLYYADQPTSRVSEHPLKHMLRRGDDHALFADFTPYMLLTTESVADLESRVSCKIAAEDFRPNFVVQGALKPYDEDEWQCIKIGSTVFRNVVPCLRCVFATVSARTGKKNPGMEPLHTLKMYRCREGSSDPFFGINLVLYLAGEVSVGDEVFVTRGSINME